MKAKTNIYLGVEHNTNLIVHQGWYYPIYSYINVYIKHRLDIPLQNV
jgi:hypothetical protein